MSNSIVFLDTHLALHELGRRDGVDSVGEMVSINNNGVFADEIVFEAEGFHLACVNVWEWAAIERVAEEDLGI